MRKRLLFILLTITMLGVISYFYINKVFLPIHLKQVIITRIEDQLRHPVTIRELTFKPLTRATAEDFVVYRDGTRSAVLFEAERIDISVFLTSFLKNRQIIIPALIIEAPYIALERNAEGTWNIQDLIRRRPADGSSPQKTPQVAIGKVVIRNGSLDFLDKMQEPAFQESVRDVNLQAQVSLDRNIQFEAKALIPKQKSLFHLSGNFSLATKHVDLNFQLQDIDLARYLPFVPSPAASKAQKALIKKLAGKMTWNLTNRAVSLTAHGDLSETRFNATADTSVESDVSVSALTFQSTPSEWTASGTLTSQSTRIKAGPILIQSGLNLNLTKLFSRNQILNGIFQLNADTLKISDNRGLNFEGKAKAASVSLERTADQMVLRGDITLDPFQFTSGQDTRVSGGATLIPSTLTWEQQTLTMKAPLKIADLHAAVKGQDIRGQLLTDSLVFEKSGPDWDIRLDGQLDDAVMRFKNGSSFQGRPKFNVQVMMNPDSDKTFQFAGSTTFHDANVTGLNRAGDLKNVRGTVRFTDNSLSTDELILESLGTPLTLKGRVTDFTNPKLDIRAASEKLDLALVPTLIPDIFQKAPLKSVSGFAAVDLTFNGSPKDWAQADMSIKAWPQNVDLTWKDKDFALKNMSGEIAYDKNGVRWKSLIVNVLNRTIQTSGQLENFSRPVVTASFINDNLSADTTIHILRSALKVVSLKGKFHGSHFDVFGDMHFEEAGPRLDVRGNVDILLQDLFTMNYQQLASILQHEPQGRLKIDNIFLQGTFPHWRDWSLKFQATSSQLTLKGYPFNDFNLVYEQRDRHVSKCSLNAWFYQGKLNANLNADLRQPSLPYQATAELIDMNLAMLREGQNLKNKDLAGKLTSSVDLRGDLADAKHSKGSGSLKIYEGRLWQWKFLKGLFAAILIPEFQDVIFTDAITQFEIRDERAHILDGRIVSQPVTLKANGWIDFQKNIHLNISPQFSEITLIQSDSLKKGPTSLLTQTVSIKVTGTLDKPAYKADSSAFKVLEKTTEVLTDGLQGIFEEIF